MIAAALAAAAAALAVAGLVSLAVTLPRPGRSGGGPVLLRLLASAGRRAGAAAPGDLHARVAAAGSPGGLGPRELMAAKASAAMAAGVLGVLLSAAAPGRLGVAVVAASPAAGFLAPDLWLARRVAERARRVRRHLPAMLDLLRVTVEAGASLPAALTAVGERSGGPLAAEWRAAGREVALGVPMARALNGMVERLPQHEVRALTAALDRARRHGAPLAGTLAAQARDARASLQRRVREDAAKAGPKIQLVVALMLVPSVLLLVAAALVAALLGSDGQTLPGV